MPATKENMTKKYYGAQTELAIKNFPFSFRRTPREFIYAIVDIKKAAALAHCATLELDKPRSDAIVAACDEILAGKHDDQFKLPAFQGGAGTSNHMNVNEVVAARATEILESRGKKQSVHGNDHVNMSHSTNDVMPSALKIAALRLADRLDGTLETFIATCEKKAKEFKDVQKLGRTHMQDAVPITMGDEFAVYAQYARQGRRRLATARGELLELNLGGSAVGNAINASPRYRKSLYEQLQKVTKLPLRQAKNMMAQTGSDGDFVVLSQALTALCLDLSKMAADFRLLSSGPKGGFAELMLPELQPGSSIMPGKVNPVMPEALSQLYYLVSGNNLAIEHAAHGAQLELGAMLPIIVDRLIESLKLSDEMIAQFTHACLAGVKANKKRAKELLEQSTAYSALLNPVIGYDAAAACVKESLATDKTLREVVIEKNLMSEKEFDRMTRFF